MWLAALVVLAAAAVAIPANLALLGWASRNDDPVGKLTIDRPLPQAPAAVVRPHEHEPGHDNHHDDDDD
jgi:hypothetical protein